MTVRSEFDFLKQTYTPLEAEIKALPMSGGGHLVPLCFYHLHSGEVIDALVRWRRKHPHMVSIVDVTNESMVRWMSDSVLAAQNRMLFLVRDLTGKLCGTIGLANCTDTEVEVDAVQRGEEDAALGVMRGAMETLIGWAQEVLNAEDIYLRVTDDNLHAIEFYNRNGFVEGKRIPLRKTVTEKGTFYREVEEGDTAPPDKHFVKMIYVKTTPKKQLQTSRPCISSRERYYAWDAARNLGSDFHGYINKFEEAAEAYFGNRHVLATSSCTGALHIALLAIGIGKGDEVIVSETTWVSSGTAVLMCGGTPVFADVDPRTWTLDVTDAERKITPNTKALLPVHVYGYPVDMRAVKDLARKYRLKIVEDAAAAIGATSGGQLCGTIGDVGCFSLQGAKTIMAGEGGFIVTKDEGIRQRARKLLNQGRNEIKPFWIDLPGIRYSISNLQAAVALGQLERVDDFNRKKRTIHGWYREGLAYTPGIHLYEEPEYGSSNYWMNSVIIPYQYDRDEICVELNKRGIETRPVFPAISQYTFWNPGGANGPVAKCYGESGINLPSALNLTKPDVLFVCKTLREVLS